MTKSICIVGIGALGSHLVQFIRNEGVVLKVVDFDRSESKNCQSQFHVKQCVGKNKTEGLKQTMQALFGAKLLINSNRLVENNINEILKGSDLIIDCVDNAKSRKLIQSYSKTNNIPCLHGALDNQGSFGRVCWTENFTIDEEGQGGATCENGDFLPFIVITAGYLAKAAQEFIRNGKKIGFQVNPAGATRI